MIILNQGYESRTSKTGKTRVTIKVRSEPVVVNTDPKSLGAPIAQAIVNHFREKIKGITATAALNTLRARSTEARAYAAGKPWAVKRFNGGRTGATPPKDSTTALNHSGRLANSITGNASSDGAWRINVAANRLDATTGAIDRILRRLNELVPEIQNPALLLQNDILKRAIDKSLESAIQKARARTSELKVQMAKALFDRLRQGAELVQMVVG